MLDGIHQGHDHSSVAPTAWGVAYLRTMTDIPLAAEMFQALDARLQAAGEPSPAWNGDRDHLAPQLEARYKLVERMLAATGCTQILELAAGVATHGINLAKTDPRIRYVELDLPGVTAQKRAIFEKIGVEMPGNLSIVDGDALNREDVLSATQSFDPSQPVAVMNEGLLRYLDFRQKAQVAKNVKAVLEKFGGFWVTPDSNLRSAMLREDEKAKGHTDNVAKKTGIDIGSNAFDSAEASQKFYEDLGFSVEPHSFLEVSDELVSPERVGMTEEDVVRLNEPIVAYVMKLKD